MPRRYMSIPAVAAALTLLLAGSLGAGAAAGGTPMSEVLGALGLGATPGETHGTAVSTAVHDAIASSTPGAGRGEAVSLAACLAAHDRSTLPPGAQTAPGRQDREPKVCATATPEDGKEPVDELLDETESEEATSTPTHGQTVRDAVHAAQASATPGVGKGAAVSEAACTAAHDRSTLPAGAQNAPGRLDKEPKDCTHPSATEAPEGTTTEPAAADSEEAEPGKGTGNGGGNGSGNGRGNANRP